MPSGHFHFGVDSVLFAGISAIIVINLVRIASGLMIKTGTGENAGKALAALV